MSETGKLIPVNRNKKNFIVGVLVGNIHTDHPMRVLENLYAIFREEGVDVRFFVGTESSNYTKNIASREADYDYQYAVLYDYSNFEELDLLIICYGTTHIYRKKGRFESFISRFPNVPTIILEAPFESENGIYLVADNYVGMKQNVDHLIEEHGCRHPVFLSGPRDNVDSNERLKAWQDSLLAHGMTPEERMVADGEFSEFADRAVEELIRQNPEADAIVCANDEMTVAAYRVLRKLYKTPGRDMPVTGFDNMKWAAFQDPPLTTIYQDAELMGTLAAKKAMQILRGERVCSERIPVRYMKRASCGCVFDPGEGRDKGGGMESQEELMEAVDSLRNFQRMSWTGALLVRELMAESDSAYDFFMETAEELHKLGVRSSYIFLLKQPMKVQRNTKWQLPDELCLMMRQRGRLREAYDPATAPMVKKGEIESCFFDSRSPRLFMNFLLFDAKKQYGIFVCEIEPKDISFYYTVALQLGTALRFLEMTLKQKEYQNELRSKNESLHFTALHDHLTGLLNRQGFLADMNLFLAKNRGKNTAFFIGDLDHLKEINDTFGHNDGDWAIKHVASILTETLGEDCPVGRAGGDEFFGMISTERETAEAFRTRVKEACKKLNEGSGKPYYLMISMGFYEFPADETLDFVEIYKKADKQLYEQKKHRMQSVVRSVN